MSPDDQLDDMALLLRATVNTISHFRHPSLRSRLVMLHDTFRAKAGGYRNGWYINDAGSNDIANVG
jgi:hypothetical protein